MRLVTIHDGHQSRAALVEAGEYVELAAADVGHVFRQGTDPSRLQTGRRYAVASVRLLAPVLQPGKIIGVGTNYRSHAAELGRPLPEFPALFAKFACALVGPEDDIVLPAVSDAVDWEVELAVVIGRHIHRASEVEARTAIGGYTILNDVSVRDWQRRTSQALQGKTFDRTSPFGPEVVTSDELDPMTVTLSCAVDDVVMQEARTDDMIFTPAWLVSYISEIVPLEPGDIVTTGTPGGVGFRRDPPVYLRAGHVLTSTISGIGEMRNRCRAADPAPPGISART
jgi:acylpyruvate hydrolase